MSINKQKGKGIKIQDDYTMVHNTIKRYFKSITKNVPLKKIIFLRIFYF